ncbi:MAG: hypothetical protein A2505_09535 [Deltaproteobacteria bacterium RIFOXYD12_FULL_55_16]|nr:MAG: hypothetical protein A2505_09535 [Deltaproteobacteria bacterium RIFOXYD12_FULL_55_16]
MYINISQDPPANALELKKRYLRLIPYLLALIFCAILLAVFQIVFGSAHGDLIENIALVLFVGPGLGFFYFAEKLHDHKTLSAKQTKEIEDLCRQDPDIAAYCAKVSLLERKLIKAEYEACKAWFEDLPVKTT